MSKLIFSLLLGFAVFGFYACDGGSTDNGHSQENNENGGEHHHHGEDDAHEHDDHDHDGDAMHSDSKYVCPMYCEGSALEEPGNCPVCGMELKLRSELKQNEDNHQQE